MGGEGRGGGEFAAHSSSAVPDSRLDVGEAGSCSASRVKLWERRRL